MASSAAFQTYLERYALLSLEKQDRLETLIGEHLHELDLDAGVIRFDRYQFPMQVIGTESDNSLTWLWAWSDEQTELPANLLQSAIQLRTWGSAEGLSEFTLPSIDLNRADGNAISLIAAEICRASCFYRDSYEGGAVYLLLFDALIDGGPAFDRQRLVRRLADLLSRYDLNHRDTILYYLMAKKLSPVTEGATIGCELESGERLIAGFDESGRLATINGAAFEL